MYAIATLVNTFGFGLVVTSLVLYFTRVGCAIAVQIGTADAYRARSR